MNKQSLFWLLLLLLCALVSSRPYLVRRIPIVYKRVPYAADGYFLDSYDDLPRGWRKRRSQPDELPEEPEYPDEFSADPFEEEAATIKARLPPGVA